MSAEDFALSPGEKLNQTVRRLCAELERRLAEQRAANDHISHDATTTASIRGRIKELKELIDLVKDSPTR